jgi:hypothetical protein
MALILDFDSIYKPLHDFTLMRVLQIPLPVNIVRSTLSKCWWGTICAYDGVVLKQRV